MQNKILDHISRTRDRDFLHQVVEAAQGRLDHLHKPGVVWVLLDKNTWYAVLPDIDTNGRNRAIKLGERMTPAAVLRRARRKPPNPNNFQIDERTAKTTGNVGWIESGNRKVFYDVAAYQDARRRWHKWHELASDPAGVAFGIPVEGIKILRRLESQNYEIRFPEDSDCGEPGLL